MTQVYWRSASHRALKYAALIFALNRGFLPAYSSRSTRSHSASYARFALASFASIGNGTTFEWSSGSSPSMKSFISSSCWISDRAFAEIVAVERFHAAVERLKIGIDAGPDVLIEFAFVMECIDVDR